MNFSSVRRIRLRCALVMISGALLLSSCGPLIHETKPKEEPVLQKKATVPHGFVSDEYIVVALQENETPADLALRFLGDRRRAWVIEEANRSVPLERGQLVVIPLKEGRGGLRPQGYQVVPVLCYHRFAEECSASLCMPAALFEEQMRYLKENGYRVISMSEFLQFVTYRCSIPEKSVVITLDDGYKSVYEIAYPILKKYGFTATLFIYTDFIGNSKSALTWDQLRQMKVDGFEVGSHTLSHCDLTRKREGESDQAFSERVREELSVSKKILDQKLGQNTAYVAFPYGEYDPAVLAVCQKVGYKLGFSVKNGENPFFSDPLTLKRDQILTKDMGSFMAKLKTFYDVPLR
jgi:peptidoglycan/xylan/chitin deacetylase (PgdA/CDA1 family)